MNYIDFLNHLIDANSALEMSSDQVLKPVVGLEMVVKKNFWNRYLENSEENILIVDGYFSDSSDFIGYAGNLGGFKSRRC